MLGVVEKMLIGLLSFSESLASMANASNFTRWISLNDQPCMTRPTLIDLNPKEYSQGLRYFQSMFLACVPSK